MEKIILTGNLGHDASVRVVPKADQSGEVPVVNFSLAVRRGWGDREQTIWYRCAWWGERAEKASAWLKKGKQVEVIGQPEARAWVPRDGGEPKAEIGVRVEELGFLGGGEKREGSASAVSQRPSVAPAPGAAAKPAETEDDPF